MQTRSKRKRGLWIMGGAIATTLILLYMAIFFYETSGGISDWRVSRALGMESTLRIPLTKTPESAVEQFRGSDTRQVIHREPVDGGMLLFMKRIDKPTGNDLQIEYVRNTWLGWKWGWGGGYAIGDSEAPAQMKTALNYMCIPQIEHISSPFPMMFGAVLDPAIKNVMIRSKDKSEYKAKLIDTTQGTIWFVLLPTKIATSLEIEGFDEADELIAHKTITDLSDSGAIELMSMAKRLDEQIQPLVNGRNETPIHNG